MFEIQIDLLEKFIADWNNVVNGTPIHDWSLSLGICSNCRLGFYSLEQLHGLSYSESKEFLEQMWKDFPGYTGDVYHPICEKGQYLLMDNFTQHPQRLELAKHSLAYLKAIGSSIPFDNSVYEKACDIIKANPEKLSFNQILNELNISSEDSNAEAIHLALAWASQAHTKYL